MLLYNRSVVCLSLYLRWEESQMISNSLIHIYSLWEKTLGNELCQHLRNPCLGFMYPVHENGISFLICQNLRVLRFVNNTRSCDNLGELTHIQNVKRPSNALITWDFIFLYFFKLAFIAKNVCSYLKPMISSDFFKILMIICNFANIFMTMKKYKLEVIYRENTEFHYLMF